MRSQTLFYILKRVMKKPMLKRKLRMNKSHVLAAVAGMCGSLGAVSGKLAFDSHLESYAVRIQLSVERSLKFNCKISEILVHRCIHNVERGDVGNVHAILGSIRLHEHSDDHQHDMQLCSDSKSLSLLNCSSPHVPGCARQSSLLRIAFFHLVVSPRRPHIRTHFDAQPRKRRSQTRLVPSLFRNKVSLPRPAPMVSSIPSPTSPWLFPPFRSARDHIRLPILFRTCTFLFFSL